MDGSMSEYISSTDELLVDDPDDPEWPETVAAYDVTFDEETEEVTIESFDGDFSGRIRGIDVDGPDELSDNRDDIVERIVELREFQHSPPGRYAELSADLFGCNYGTTDMPVGMAYLYDADLDSMGVRFWTEVDGHTYGFESSVSEGGTAATPVDMFEGMIERQFRQMAEELFNNHVVDSVTLDAD